MREFASRFPLLPHLSWSRQLQPVPRHHLGMSAVPTPPPEIFDPDGGPTLLDPQGAGERELIGLLAARYRVPEARVLPAAGVSEALYLSCAARIEPGDWVLVESPAYQSLAGVARSLGAEVRPLARGIDGALDPAETTATIKRTADQARAAGRQLAMVLVSDLHNPTGARLSDAVVDALAEGARSAGATLLLDEVYRDVDSTRRVGTAHERHPETVAISSLTKAYGFGGFRVGWMIAPPEIRAAGARVQHYLSVNPSGPAVGVGIRALAAADRILAWARPILEENRQTLAAALYDRPSGFTLPAGASVGTVAFPYRAGGPDTLKEAEIWRESHGVSVVPGAWFGAPSGVRVGLGKSPAAFRVALEAWQLALSEPARA